VKQWGKARDKSSLTSSITIIKNKGTGRNIRMELLKFKIRILRMDNPVQTKI